MRSNPPRSLRGNVPGFMSGPHLYPSKHIVAHRSTSSILQNPQIPRRENSTTHAPNYCLLPQSHCYGTAHVKGVTTGTELPQPVPETISCFKIPTPRAFGALWGSLFRTQMIAAARAVSRQIRLRKASRMRKKKKPGGWLLGSGARVLGLRFFSGKNGWVWSN